MSIIYTRKGEKALVQFAIGLRELTYPAGYTLTFHNPRDLTVAELVSHKTQAQWNGEGLPPVGVEFEWRYGDHAWKKGEALYIGSIYAVLKSTEGGEQHYYLCDMQFRPIRTAEQIAAEERERQVAGIDRAFRVFVAARTAEHRGHSGHELAEYLYDAGARMPGEGSKA